MAVACLINRAWERPSTHLLSVQKRTRNLVAGVVCVRIIVCKFRGRMGKRVGICGRESASPVLLPTAFSFLEGFLKVEGGS